MFCPRCGAARAGELVAAEHSEQASESHTILRGSLSELIDHTPQGPSAGETATLDEVSTEAIAATPAIAPAIESPTAPQWSAVPAAPPGGASGGGTVPGAIRLVCVTLIAVAALLLYPVFRWGGPLVGSLFSGGLLGFSFAILSIYMLAILAMMGSALVALSFGLWRGSRVSQGITIILSASIGLGELIQSPKDAGGGGQPAWITYLIALGCVLIIVALVIPQQVRQFLAEHDGGPLGIGIARTICVYFGWVVAVDGVLLMMIGGIGKQYLFWGLGFFVIAALLLWSQILLLSATQQGAVLATTMLGIYIVLDLAFRASAHAPVDASTVIGFCVAGCAMGALWLPQSSRDFHASPGAVQVPWRQPALAGGVAFAVLFAMGVGGCVVGSIAASKASGFDASASDYAPLSDDPTATPTEDIYPTDTPTGDPYASDTPTPTWSPEATFTHQWTSTATASGGYAESVLLETGTPEHFTDGMMNGSVTAGSSCTINPATDAVVPAKLTVTNTSPGGFASYPAVGIGFNFEWNDAAAEVGYSDGDQCQSSDFNVDWTSSLASGHSAGIDMFFVLSNYYTPDSPDGDPSLLANAQIDFTPASDSTDDLTYTPTAPHGQGIDPSSEYFPIVPD